MGKYHGDIPLTNQLQSQKVMFESNNSDVVPQSPWIRNSFTVWLSDSSSPGGVTNVTQWNELVDGLVQRISTASFSSLIVGVAERQLRRDS